MDILEAVSARHSVRRYLDKPIDGEVKSRLLECIDECNKRSGLNIQLVLDEPKAFDSIKARYGKFSGVKNYIALVGKNTRDLYEKCGYYGEKIVLLAQTLGLNTCWVGATFSKVKGAFEISKEEKLALVIAIGYGETQGKPHKSKKFDDVTSDVQNVPEWFVNGVKCALLAPTALNQQKFKFSVNGRNVFAKAGKGFFVKVDLGIVKYHFELGAGRDNFSWQFC
ncbi:MAG: nitroreductase family protein [Bacteroides sp.]|nr:nitroreductase family protein [Bacillota bacterium]MCM1393309.1 nitroreductase family protein [[Eubacterium] siraeum]MCM1455234.1 nitroreductase family protein [Bacteroides sp.]